MKQLSRLIFILFLLALNVHSELKATECIFPVPQQVNRGVGYFGVKSGRAILEPSLILSLKDDMRELLLMMKKHEICDLDLTAALAPNEIAALSLRVDPAVVQKPQGYRIDITKESIELIANNEVGAYYAISTLKQVIENSSNSLKCINIEDWPDFERRGIMLDISRDKVPSIESIKLMLDRFASWKVNEVQLYVEHTFAYTNHETVWKNASPLTAEEVLELDVYCRERYIDLVPNQNSLGHMERWLKHEEYFHLAERPDKIESDNWIINGQRMTLCAVNPDAVEFMDSLYAEYLPNFSSKFANIGGDEPYELGYGLSAEACKELGKSTVYLNYMKKVVKRVNQYGKKAQMWGDIVTHHPELIPQMPKDNICMVWGYRPEHPFEQQCSKFHEEGIPFYVCPGTSGWRSFIGKTQRALLNINNAIENGKKYGAIGVLNTDWGDLGHHQPITTAYPALLYGAALSWASETNKNIDLVDILNVKVFDDETNNIGEAIMQLSNAYMGGQNIDQAGRPYFNMLERIDYFFTPEFKFKNYDLELLPDMRIEIAKAVKKLENAHPLSHDGNIAIQELKTAAKFADWGCRLVQEQIKTPDQFVYQISMRKRKEFAKELEAITLEHTQTWLLRNRSGGLDDSVERLNKVKENLIKAIDD